MREMALVGRVLGDRYEVLEPIARGGTAHVYRARDRALGEVVAVKVLIPDLAEDPDFLTRFRKEALVAGTLTHPNVVRFFGAGDEEGVHYIVMEEVAGRTLAEVLRAEGRLSGERAVEIARDVCAALEAAEEAGIVHRDIKPTNIMLTHEGVVKVMDFGVARVIDSTRTQTGIIFGSAPYVSPEQASGARVDRRGDIYSLGCVIYEMLTGRPPFQADSPVTLLFKHFREQPVPPSTHVEGIPATLDAVVLKTLAKNPADRYERARTLSEHLRAALAPTVARSAMPADPREPAEPVRAASGHGHREAAAEASGGSPKAAAWLGIAWMVLAVTSVIVLAFAVLARDGGPSAPASEQTSVAQASPTARSASGPSYAGALAGVAEVVQDSLRSGEISRRVADKVLHEVDEALRRYREGKRTDAVRKLDELAREVSRAAERRQVSSRAEERLLLALRDLLATFR